MSWNEQEVVAALSHAEMAVRDRALETLGSAYPNSTAAMPAVIRAIEQYGWDDAFASLYYAHFLPQSRETIAWAWKELNAGISRGEKEEPWYCFDLASIIAYADPATRDEAAEQDAPVMKREGLHKVLLRPLELSKKTDDELWRRLTVELLEPEAAQQVSRVELFQLAIAVGSRKELAPRLWEKLVALNQGGENVGPATGRIAAIALGVARYAPAVSALFDYASSGDAALGPAEGEAALAKIGGAEVVAELRKRIENVEYLRSFGARLFGLIPADASLTAGLSALEKLQAALAGLKGDEEDYESVADAAADLAESLLFHFDAKAIEPAAALARVFAARGHADVMLEAAIGIAAELLDAPLAERAEWFAMAVAEAEENRERVDPDFDPTGNGENVFYEGFDPTNLPASPSINVAPLEMPRRRRHLVAMRPTPDPEAPADRRLIPIRRPDAPIGRNERCPCGSGKKYKNCCFRKV